MLHKRSLVLLVALFLVGSSLTVLANSSIDDQPFVVPEGVFSAQQIRNEDGVAIIEFSGDYNRLAPDGANNAAARAVVAREFYRNNPDNYDFLVVFTSFEFETGDAEAFHHGVSNSVEGIGQPIYSNTQIYGSESELKGFIDMAALSRYESNPLTALSVEGSANFDDVLKTLAHETLHQWAAHSQIPDLQGSDDAHWSFFLDTDGSLEYGHDWRDNQDGSFTAVNARSIYSPLDLYLMGIHGPENVPDMFVINPDDNEYSADDLPKPGITITGTRQDYSIQDFINVHGERQPDATNAVKSQRYGFIYLTPFGSTVPNIEIAKINAIRKAFSERYSILTGGKGLAIVYPQVQFQTSEGVAAQLIGGDELNTAANTEDALDWLEAQQNLDGRWQDRPATAIRDTEIVHRVLTEFRPGHIGLNTAANWLNSVTPISTDSSARALSVVPNHTTLVQKLLANQNADGGWGLSNSFSSSVLDSALAMCALANQGIHAANVDKAADFVYQMQNADGGWSSSDNSGSSLTTTAQVAQALHCAAKSDTRASAAISFLASGRNTDSGFGDGQSSVHETAAVVLAMLTYEEGAQIDFASALDYIGQRQSVEGDWNGSVYTTALAAKALLSARLPNLGVESIEVVTTPVHDGDFVALETTLHNDSRDTAPPSVVRLFLGDPSAGGNEFAQANVPALPPFASVVIKSVWDSYGHAGNNKIYAFADADNEVVERTEVDNQLFTEVAVNAPPAGVDLSVSDSEFFVEPVRVTTLPSQQNLLATIRNLGDTDADSVEIQLWQGDPSVIGVLLETMRIDVASRSSAAVNSSHLLTQEGVTHFNLILDADNQFAEVNENNNSAVIEVETISGVDLEVLPVDIVLPESAIYLGQDVPISVRVRNNGTTTTPNSSLVVNLRNSFGETELLGADVNLQPGEEKTFSTTWRADYDGVSEVVVKLDAENFVAEINESNNIAVRNFDVGLAHGNNLSVNFTELTVSPNPAFEGMSTLLSAIVRNTGTADIASAEIAFYDGDPIAGGALLGAVVLSNIASSQAAIAQFNWINVPDNSTRFVYVVADSSQSIDELNETDNVAFIKLEVLSLADLAISTQSIQSNPVFPNIDQVAQFSIQVTNRGMQAVQSVDVVAHAGPDSSSQIIASSSLDIAAAADSIWTFEHSFDRQGDNSVHVVVDPEQRVIESNENNNSATRSFLVQDGEFYLSDRFISPDGNGIKDTVDYFFTLQQDELISVSVVNQYGREVVELSVSDQAVGSGSVAWDGRNTAGGVVADGDYIFAVKDSSGALQGERSVTVDTNRSPLSEALETEFAVTRNLSCRIGEVHSVYKEFNFIEVPDTQNILYGPNDQYIYFATYFEPVRDQFNVLRRTDEKVRFPSGIYRAYNDGSNVVQLVSDQQIVVGGNSREGLRGFNISADGERLVLVTSSASSSSASDFWSVSTDGSDFKYISTVPGGDFLDDISDVQYTSENQIVYLTRKYYSENESTVWRLADQEGATPVPLFSVDSSIPGEVIWAMDLNASRSHALLKIDAGQTEGRTRDSLDISYDLLDSPGDYWLYLLDLSSGESQEISSTANSHSWSPLGDSFAFAERQTKSVQTVNLSAQVTQNIGFNLRQSNDLSDEEKTTLYSYLSSFAGESALSADQLIGRFSGLSWSPDGSRLAFVFEDHIASIFYSDGCEFNPGPVGQIEGQYTDNLFARILQFLSPDANAGVIFDPRSNCLTPPEEIQNLIQKYKSMDGLYVVNIQEADIELLAKTSTTEVSYANVGPISDGPIDVFPIVSTPRKQMELNEQGLEITEDGYPYVIWVGTAWAIDTHRNTNWDTTETLRSIQWLSGSNEILISGGDRFYEEYTVQPNFDEIDFEDLPRSVIQPLNQSVLLSLENPVQASRVIFEDRNLEFEQSLPQRRGVYSTNTGQFLSFFSDDESDFCVANGETQGYRQFQSLLNMTADLRVRRSSKDGGFILEGSATDRNMDFYQLDYADANSPDQWMSIAPPSDQMVIDDRFTTWVAPYIGSFLVRLTVVDLAGNQRRDIQRVSNAERPVISDIYLTPPHFSPNGDGIKDAAEVHFRVLEPVNLVVNILNSNDSVVRTFTQSYDVIGSQRSIVWNGRDDAGQLQEDGKYKFVVEGYEFFTELDVTAPLLIDQTSSLFQPIHSNRPDDNCDFQPEILIPEAIENEFLQSCRVFLNSRIEGTVEDHNLDYSGLESRLIGTQQWLPVNVGRLKSTTTITSDIRLQQWRDTEFRYVAVDLAGNRSELLVNASNKQNKAHIMFFKPGVDLIRMGFDFQSSGDFGIRPEYLYSIDDAPQSFRLFFQHTMTEQVQFTELLYRAADSDNPYKSINLNIEKSTPGFSFVLSTDQLETIDGGQYEIRVRMKGFEGAVLETNSVLLRLDWRVYEMPASSCGPGGAGINECGSNIPNVIVNNIVNSPVVDVGTNIPERDIDRILTFLKSVGPRQDIRYIEDEVWELTEIRQLGNGATELITHDYEPGGQIIKTDLAAVLAPGRDSDPDEGIYEIVFPPDEHLNLINECGFDYELRGLVFHHGSFLPKPFLFQHKGSCLDISVDVDPVFAEQCDATPTGQAEISLRLDTQFLESASSDIVEAVNGEQIAPLLFQIGDPALDAQGEESVINPVVVENFPSVRTAYRYLIDTSQLPGGEQIMRILVELENGDLEINDFVLPVVHQAPSLALTFPQSGQKVCASEYKTRPEEVNFGEGATVKGIEIQGELRSQGPDAILDFPFRDTAALANHYRFRLNSASPLFDGSEFDNIANEFREDAVKGSFLGRTRVVDSTLVDTASIDFNPQLGGLQATGVLSIPTVDKSGQLNLQLQATNWSGARMCKEISVDVDAEVDGLLLEWSGAKIVQNPSLGSQPFISPDSATGFNALTLDHFADEAVVFNMAVYSTTIEPDTGEIINHELVARLYENESLLPQSDNQFTWDGRDDAGNVVVDGLYQIEVSSRDGCGNTDIQNYVIGVDTTPPELAINFPTLADNRGLQVRVLGRVNDPHPDSYQLFISTTANDFILLESSTGNQDGLLGQWNSFGASGTPRLQLKAVDALGNEASIEQDFILPVREQLISSHTTTEYLFSPNGDSRLDTLTVRTSFDIDVIASFEVFDSQGLVKTLIADQPFNAGFTTVTWDGIRSLGGVSEDGIYKVRVTASAGSNVQTEEVGFELDNTPPTLSLPDLNGEHIESLASGQIFGAVSDKNFLDYAVSVKSVPETPRVPILPQFDEVISRNAQINGLLAQLPVALLDQEQEYNVKFLVRDEAGNHLKIETRMLVDPVPPEIKITAPEFLQVFNSVASPVQILGYVRDSHLRSYQAGFASVENPDLLTQFFESPTATENDIAAWDTSGLPDGDYVVHVTASDKGGLKSAASVAVTIDNLPPEVAIHSPAENGYLTQLDQVLGVANDAHFEQYTLAIANGNVQDGGNFRNLMTSNQVVINETLLNWSVLPADGTYTFLLSANDAAGNTATLYHAFTVDTSPPPEVDLISVELLVNSKTDVRIKWRGSIASDIAGYELYRDGVKINSTLLSDTQFEDIALEDGDYAYSVRAIDLAGLQSVPSNSVEIVIDTTAPSTIIASPTNDQRVNLLVDIFGTAYSRDDFKNYRLLVGQDPNNLQQIHRSAATVRAGLMAQWDTLGILDGERYIIRLESEDTRGNTNSHQIEVVIDNAAPAAPINLQANINNGSDAQLSWQHSVPPTDLLGYLLYRNGQLVNADQAVVGDLRPYAITGLTYADSDLPDGDYSYLVYAIDQAGNVSLPSNEAQFSLNERPPRAVIANVFDDQEFDLSLDIFAESADQDIQKIELQYRDGGEWVAIAELESEPYTFLWDTSALPFGYYQLRAVATDTSGLVDPFPNSVEIRRHDLTAPQPPQDLSIFVVGDIGSLSWTANEELDLEDYLVYRSSCLDCELDRFEIIDLVSGSEITFDDTVDPDVTYVYAIVARDASGNRSTESARAIGVYLDSVVSQPEYIVQAPTGTLSVALSRPQREFDTVRVQRSLGNGVPSSEQTELSAAVTSHQLIEELETHGVYNFTVAAGSLSENYIASSASATLVSSGKPSDPTGLSVELDVATDEVFIRWTENPAAEQVTAYQLFRNDIPVWGQKLIDDAAVSASGGSNINSTLPQVNDESGWTTGRFPGAVYLDQVWVEPRRVGKIEMDWIRLGTSASHYSIFARIDGEFVQVASHQVQEVDANAQIENEPVSHSINLPVAIATDSIRVQIDAWYDTYEGGHLGKMRVYADRLFSAPQYFRENPGDGIYQYAIKAVNKFGGISDLGEPVSIVYGDVIPPVAPTLSAHATESAATISWTEVSDASGYELYRNNEFLVHLDNLEYHDVNLLNGQYVYFVRAVDPAGNQSLDSNMETVLVDVSSPAAPIGLQAVANNVENTVDLGWQTATADPVGYRIYRSLESGGTFSPITDTSVNSYVDTDVVQSVAYFYHVVELDAAGNESVASNEADAQLLDLVPPFKPIIKAPTDSIGRFITEQMTTDIVGFSEVDSEVYLVHQGVILPTAVTVSDQPYLESLNYGAQGRFNEFEVQADGSIIATWGDFLGTGVLLYFKQGAWQEVPLGPVSNIFSIRRLLLVDGENILIQHSAGISMVSITTGATTPVQLNLPSNMQLRRIEGFSLANSKALLRARVDSGAQQLYQFDLQTNQVDLITGHEYRVSPDARRVAYSGPAASGETEVFVHDLIRDNIISTTVSGTSIDDVFDTRRVWSPGSDKLLLSANLPVGHPRAVVFDINAQTSTSIEHPTAPISDAVWNGNGGVSFSVSDSLSNQAFLFSYELGSGRTIELGSVALPTSNAATLFGASNGQQLIVRDAITREYFKFVPAGVFRFPDVALEDGDNYFSALALDDGFNLSEPADDILVVYQKQDLPDFELVISVNPEIPLLGNPANVRLQVSNIGTTDALPTEVRVSVIDPEGNSFDLSNQQLGAVATGSTITLNLSWTPQLAGTHTFIATVDRFNEIVEISEANNTRIITQNVVDNAVPIVQLQLANSVDGNHQFAANQPLSGTVTVVNAGDGFTGELQVQVVDAANNLVAEVARYPVTNLPYAAQLSFDYQWNTTDNLATTYQIVASLIDLTSETVASDLLGFEIIDVLAATLALRSDRFSYSPNQDVLFTATARNQSMALILQDAEIELVVTAADGSIVHQASQPLLEMLPDETAALRFVWNTGANPAGIYSSSSRLVHNGVEIARSQADIQILFDQAGLQGELSLPSVTLLQGQNLLFDSLLLNQSNSGLSGITVSYHLSDGLEEVAEQFEVVAGLGIGQQSRSSLQFSNSLLQPGNYRLQMIGTLPQADVPDLRLLLDQQFLSVVENTAPVVDITVPQAGAVINSQKTRAQIRATDDAGIRLVEARIDSQTWHPVSASVVDPGSYYMRLNQLMDGVYQLDANAMDNNDNNSNIVERSFTVDNTPPQITFENLSPQQQFNKPIIPLVSIGDLHLAETSFRLNGVVWQPGSAIAEDRYYTLVVEANDLAGNSSREEITFQLNIDNETPPILTLVNDQLNMARGVWGTINVLENDQFADLNQLQLSVLTPPESGTLIVASKGVYNYFPGLGFVGSDQFTYEIQDGVTGLTASAIVAIDVAPTANCSMVPDHVGQGDQPISLPNWARTPGDTDDSPDYKIVILNTSRDTAFQAGGLPVISFPDCSLRYTPAPNTRAKVRVNYRVIDVRSNGARYTSPVRTFELSVDSKDGNNTVVVPILDLLLLSEEEK